NKQVSAAMIAMLGVIAFEESAAAEQRFQRLTGAQIQAKFPGMELTDEAHWARSSSETARSRSRPWAIRAPASGGSTTTSFVSTRETNGVAVVMSSGFPAETWS